MKILTEGHKYELESFEGSNTQVIQFIHKEPFMVANALGKVPQLQPNENTEGRLWTIEDGTTNEEVLKVLIDRMQSLQAKFPCRENAIVITKLEESLMWLNKRTEDRKRRNVEGKQIA